METTKTNNEAFTGSLKTAEKWFGDVNAATAEIYARQLNLATGFYNNLFNAILESSKGGNANRNFTGLYFYPAFTNWPSLFGSNNSFNPFIQSFDSVFRQMLDNNRNLLATVYTETKNDKTGWSGMTKEYRDAVENQFEISKKILESISETYARQLDFSIETNKKITEEINSRFNSMLKQNMQFLTDMLSTTNSQSNGKEDGNNLTNHTESKKKNASLAV